MRLEPNSDQQMMADTFARFLRDHSSTERVRAAAESRGFDPVFWRGLAELGALAIRVPEEAGGLGLGTLDAALLMEECGRRLAPGPVAEALMALRLLTLLDPLDDRGIREPVLQGASVLTLALQDIAADRAVWVAGGCCADWLIAREGERVVLVSLDGGLPQSGTLAATGLVRLSLSGCERWVLATGKAAVATFDAAVEEWKLLMGAALIGLAREAVRLAADYACEREQFGKAIGRFQAVAHPLADSIVEIDAGQLLLWRSMDRISRGETDAAASLSLACWWACKVAEQATARSLHTFGGYGLTLEYDIHLYNLRAKEWPLVCGDPGLFLDEAGRRLFADEGSVALPNVGALSIDFDLGPEAEALAAETATFFERHLTPARQARAHYSWDGHDPEFHRLLGEVGLLFPAWPRRLGGRDASPYAVQAVLEVWHRHRWTTHGQATCNMVGFIMDQFGSPTLKDEALTRVARGEASCALGFSEPGAGSDVFAARTRATRDTVTGDGLGWRIDGQKMFTSGAEWADYILLLARTDDSALKPGGSKHRGLTMFVVPMPTEGVSIQPVHTFQDERTNVTFYDNVWVPDSYRLGEVGKGIEVMSASLRVEHSMTLVKEHEHLLRAAVRFCRQTERSSGVMIDDVAVQRRLAAVAVNVAAAEVLNYRALWVKEEGKADLAYGPASKMLSSELYQSDAFDLLNMTAPESLAFESPEAAFINQCFRHSQVGTIYGGTSEVHRSMVAEQRLGLPRSR